MSSSKLVRLLYHKFLKLGARFDAEPFLKTLLLKDPDKPDHFKRGVLHSDAFYKEDDVMLERRLRSLLREIIHQGSGDIKDYFKYLKWLSETANAGSRLQEHCSPDLPSVPDPPLYSAVTSLDHLSGMMLVAHPLPYRCEIAPPVVCILGDTEKGLIGVRVNRFVWGRTLEDLVNGKMLGVVLNKSPYLSALAECPLVDGGYGYDNRSEVNLTILHPYPEVEGSVQVAEGLCVWGNIGSIRKLCEDPNHPAEAKDFSVALGCLLFDRNDLTKSIANNAWAPLASAPGPRHCALRVMQEAYTFDPAYPEAIPHKIWQAACLELGGQYREWARYPAPDGANETTRKDIMADFAKELEGML